MDSGSRIRKLHAHTQYIVKQVNEDFNDSGILAIFAFSYVLLKLDPSLRDGYRQMLEKVYLKIISDDHNIKSSYDLFKIISEVSLEFRQ